MTPYRFTFETDEQYQQRAKQLEDSSTSANPETSVSPSPIVTDGGKGGPWLLLPWWALLPIAVVTLLYAFRIHRRSLINKRLARLAEIEKQEPHPSSTEAIKTNHA